MRLRTLLLIVIVAAGALASVVACDSSGESGGESETIVPAEVDQRDLSFEEYVAEYRSAAAKLTLPPGQQWPDPIKPPLEPAVPGGPPLDTVYEPGAGVQLADNEWFCAWLREWLDSRGKDLAREAAALDELGHVNERQMYIKNESVQDLFDETVEKAALGDPTLATEWVSTSCLPPPAR